MHNRKKRIHGLKCRVKGNRIVFYSELSELIGNEVCILADETISLSAFMTLSHKLNVFKLSLKPQKSGTNFECTNKRLAEVWRIVFATDDVEFWLTYDPKTRLFTKL